MVCGKRGSQLKTMDLRRRFSERTSFRLLRAKASRSNAATCSHMPTLKAIDPLWQCLCPSWSAPAVTRTPRVFSRTRRAALQGFQKRTLMSDQNIEAQRRHTSVVYNPLDPVRTLRPYQSRLAPGHRGTATPGLPPRHQEAEPDDSPTTALLAQETTNFLYGRLSSAAIDGKAQQCRQIAEYLVKERREKPSVQLYNALILANISHDQGSAWRATELLDEMKDEGMQPDAGTCHAVLKVVAVHLDHLLRTDILDYMQQRWYTLSEDGEHDVVAGLLREGLFESALNRLDKMRRDGTRIEGWLSDMAVYTLCEAGEVDEAWRIMRGRYDAGQLLGRNLWAFLLDKGSEARHHEAVSLVWTSQVNQGYLNPSSGICLNALTTAAQVGDATLATEVFACLSKRGTAFQPIHYELLISTYLSADPPDVVRALSILTIMPLEKLEPSAAETRTLYIYLRDKPALLQEAFSTLRELHSQGRKIPIAALNLLIECYAEQRDLSEAMKIYKLIHTFVPISQGAQKSFANIETFNLLFKACRVASPPDDRQASFLVSELLALRITPTALTYDRLILVFLEAAKVHFLTASETLDIGESEAARESALELLDWAFRHFADMQPLKWMPRLGTIELLAVQLAQGSDERCWDVLQLAEDQSDNIEGFAAKGKWARQNVEEAISKAKDVQQPEDASEELEKLAASGVHQPDDGSEEVEKLAASSNA